MKTPRTLFFFCISFPYAEGESFIVNEFPYLLESFDNIEIITSSNKSVNISLSPKVNVHSIGDIVNSKPKAGVFFKNIFSIARILSGELGNCRSKSFFLKNARKYNSTLINSFICAEYITCLKNFDRGAAFYSFWMNNHALTLAVLKMQNKIDRMLFRVHGYDLILERWPYKYIAFQRTCHKFADRIYTVSEKSRSYFRDTYKQKNKAEVAYLGSADRGINPHEEEKDLIRIVSCSNIIPLKRLHLIIQVLEKMNSVVEWVHFGDGFLAQEIKAKVAQLPAHIKTIFKGRVSQQELFEYYSKHHIDLFINVSDSEGLPFTIIEATSFGIPVIATDAGGTSEIVNNITGYLLRENFDPGEVSDLMQSAKLKEFRSQAFRRGVRQFWKDNFFAGKVYPLFITSELLNPIAQA